MRIGELAQATGTTTKTLRFYEARGLLHPPARTPGGYRDYPEAALFRLDFIRRGQSAGLTLAQIQQILTIRDGGHAPCSHVQDLLAERVAKIDRQIADLVTLRTTVSNLHAASDTVDPGACRADQVCKYV